MLKTIFKNAFLIRKSPTINNNLIKLKISPFNTTTSEEIGWPKADKFKKIAKCSNLHLRMDDDQKNIHVSIPNLCPIDSVDISGNMNLTSLHIVYAKCRIYATSCLPETANFIRNEAGEPVPFLQFLDLAEDRLPFQITMETTINESYYKLPEKAPCDNLQFSFQLGYIGGSSYNTFGTLNNKATREVYSTCTTQLVNVNTVTRKPEELPQWWTERFSSLANKSIQNLKIAPFMFPGLRSIANIRRHSLKISLSDIDYNGHTTHMSYTKFSLEALRSRGKGSQNFSQPSYFAGLYVNESNVNDKITIYTWPEDENTFKIMIYKRMNILLFQCTIKFY